MSIQGNSSCEAAQNSLCAYRILAVRHNPERDVIAAWIQVLQPKRFEEIEDLIVIQTSVGMDKLVQIGRRNSGISPAAFYCSSKRIYRPVPIQKACFCKVDLGQVRQLVPTKSAMILSIMYG